MQLPAPITKGTVSVEEALSTRRSRRRFHDGELTSEQISQLLWSAQGAGVRGLRHAPSAGATYPLELYVATAHGVFHYEPMLHQIEVAISGDCRPQLRKACLNQSWVDHAPAVFIIAAVYERTAMVYGPRAERYVHMEAGHAAQNIHLQAVALGLGSVPVGAFRDKEVKQALSLPADHEPLYVIPVGYSAE